MGFVLLVAALAVVVLVNVAGGRVEEARRRVAEAPPGGGGHFLGPYELAYLAGGPRRAINTALAVLATAGAVRVSRGSRVTAVHGARPSPVPIEQAALDALASRPGGYRAAELRRELESQPALAALAAELEARGLLVPRGAFATAWRRRDQLAAVTWLAAGFVALVVTLKVTGALSGDEVFGGTVLFGVFAVIVGFGSCRKHGRRLRNVVTREGREVLRAARAHHPRGVRDPGSLALAVGVPVALYGLADAGDPALCDELAAGDPGGDCAGACGTYSGGDGPSYGDSYGGSDFGGSDSGGSSGCGSGSDGGSSCGGGGCGGGCGGGGD
ncbi:TIGR04222 domain-containing membrane protein [Actinomadura sp. ATCC 31491]|uniref:TIGR04222 domain-containing membrane protein n=1 Tax=Actinomadura luzonensis TaxID=2805427 RepID=A0ABT0FLF4_9ACTN|nr:TIGR04222 domain-containing membrane protein [Actinomadura luzonensis]MCK2213159.1 TIGR04222 domain-containing membrane protein [Actinomadura luzonensis]